MATTVLDDVNLIKGPTASSNTIHSQNTWALETEKTRAGQAPGDFDYNPRGSRYLDVDDGILPNAEQRASQNQWPWTRVLGSLLAVAEVEEWV